MDGYITSHLSLRQSILIHISKQDHGRPGEGRVYSIKRNWKIRIPSEERLMERYMTVVYGTAGEKGVLIGASFRTENI